MLNLPLSSSHNIWNLNILTIFCNPIFSQIINFSLKLIVLLCWFSSTSFVIGQSQIKHEDMKIIMVIIDNLRQISNMVALACSYPRGHMMGQCGVKTAVYCYNPLAMHEYMYHVFNRHHPHINYSRFVNLSWMCIIFDRFLTQMASYKADKYRILHQK